MEIQAENNAVSHAKRIESNDASGVFVDQSFESIHINTQKTIELDDDLKEKLTDFPEILEFIEKLQKIIQKQVKKILKWKTKVKQLSQKTGHDIATQTHFGKALIEIESNQPNGLHNEPETINEKKSVSEHIREAAEEALQSSGFVYEETSGLYYDYNSGYYYNAEYGLYYDGTTGTYLKYNQENQSYEFHSQVSTSDLPRPASAKHTKRRPKKQFKPKDTKRPRRDAFAKDLEEGECSESSLNSDGDSSVSDSSDLYKKYPPCMRMIVESTEIPKIKAGSLFIITCDGGSIGREGNHSVCLPDINVSKHHLQVKYNSTTSKYVIIDMGSRNGTLLNGKRISSSKQESEPFEVSHGSKLQIGSTVLLCHIHDGTETCGHCEPGLLLEEEKDPPVSVSNKKTINQQFKSELKRLRKRHGFMGSSEDSLKLGEGYTDRAQKRRDEVGSQNPYEKTESTSLDASISTENKGFKMLSKMGWKEGQSLGKDGTGLKEPVNLVSNTGTAGIGAASEANVPDVSKKSKQTIWKKTQERFDKLPDKKVFHDDSDG